MTKKGRSDLRNVKAPMHRAASWMGARGTEAEALRVRACSRASKEAAAGRTLALLAVDIFAQLLPSLPRVLEEEIRATE